MPHGRISTSDTLRSFLALFLLGLLGIGAQAYDLLVVHEQAGAVQGILVQTALLAGGVWIGLVLAPKLGFRSRVHDLVQDREHPFARGIRRDARPALLLGTLIGCMLVVIEWTTDLGPAWSLELLVVSLPQRVLWGGITEELIVRWGIMSVVVFVAWLAHSKVTSAERSETRKTGSSDVPGAAVVWTGIVLTALLFGIMHLPAVGGVLTPGLVALVIAGNAVGGIAFGWLFWRFSLEAAMIAHGFAHVFFIAVWSGVLLVG